VETPVDPPVEDPPNEGSGDPRPVDRWRRSTASGAVTAAFALGLQHVFDPERADTIAIEQEAPTKPVDRERVELRFDPLSSSGSVVVVHRREDGGDATEVDDSP
jgi:hypothetical protein